MCSRAFPGSRIRSGSCRHRDNPRLKRAVREVLERRPQGATSHDRVGEAAGNRAVLTRPARPTPFAFPSLVEIFRETLTTERPQTRVARMMVELEKAAQKRVTPLQSGTT